MAEKTIFREAALERLSSPEQLDRLTQVTRPKGWIALIVLILLIVTALLWGFFSTISTRVAGQGIIAVTGNVNNVVATVSGQITRINLKAGQVVEEGQIIASLFRWDTDPAAIRQIYQVVSPYSGRVVEMKAEEGQLIERGTAIVSLEPLGRRLEAVVYVTSGEGKKVLPGMDAEVAPVTVKPEEFGYIMGRVRSVSQFPKTQQGMQSVLGMKELAEKFGKEGPPYEVFVELLRDPQGSGGFQWSSKGPDIPVEKGTLCAVKIVVRKQSPVSLLVPFLKKTVGLYAGPTLEEGKRGP